MPGPQGVTKKPTVRTNKVNYTRQPYICQPDCCRVDKRHVSPSIENYCSLVGSTPIGKIHNIPDSVIKSPYKNMSRLYLTYKPFGKYKVEQNKGINPKGARQIDVCLAKYSLKVAETMDTAMACYTGVKHALWSSGVLNDYGDMPLGSAYKAKEYFDKYPNKFEKVNIEAKDLKTLPAGYIIVYSKEGLDGHIAITNGNGQEMSDCTDNMMWLEEHGKGSSFSVYKLTDNWSYNKTTMKLEFNDKK